MSVTLEIFKISSIEVVSDKAFVLENDDSGDFVIDSRSIDEELYVESEYPFTALQEYRRILRSKGMDVNCYGALPNVYPSPMLMNSTKAYYLTMHEPATMKCAVEIFDYFKVGKSSSVDSQDDFYRKWIKSL